MLKLIDTLAGTAAAFVWAVVFYGASTSYASAQMPPWLSRPVPQAIVCASLDDVKDVATQDTNSKGGADFSILLKEGKCARVPGWPEIIADLDSLAETEIEYDGKHFIVRSAPRPAATLALRAAGVALPPTIRDAAVS